MADALRHVIHDKLQTPKRKLPDWYFKPSQMKQRMRKAGRPDAEINKRGIELCVEKVRHPSRRTFSAILQLNHGCIRAGAELGSRV